ncbi:dihydroorotate oxidase B electron transfer subunit [Aneurinibacillus soli]|uniref:Dihydroorotate dehydrogenase B (NAD(+)), electron transfer subunit n=1 Tax=Aneurinibacillus soli TaxID=1500254 RepID=A0A0U5B2I0_9BACL|nr:dihydroorotate dehydrogenase electron transfer subunit [Aneurinibacillus soli]PYE63548.1 dihydroorotate oxidase B electron transfer subunit [Aneurinibacillus soli]BAU27519.1 Dihydroorotate dehydrogenase B (NAD(+)), electron transfer subunit [Aneurinibacillus soli]
MDKGLVTVIANEQIAERIYRLQVQGELVGRMTRPGQFVHIKCGTGIDPLLRRPISICDVDADKQILTMIFRADGHGTRVLSESVPGQSLDILAPLGEGFPVDTRTDGEHALLIGGGIGVPPLYYLGKQLRARGVKVTFVIGFGTASQVFLTEELAELGTGHVVTMDGSAGTKGLVTDVLTEANGLAPADWDVLYSCGPLPMLRALQDTYQKLNKEGYISLEERMGCGVGACLACVCSVQEPQEGKKKYKKICSDGPVFAFGEVRV